MWILYALLIGLVVGALAKLLMPGRDGGGIVLTTILGMAGALLASLIGNAFGWYRTGAAPGIIVSVVGAMLILGAYRLLRRTNTARA